MSLLTLLMQFADPRVDKNQPARPATVPNKPVAIVVDDDPGMRSLMSLSLDQCGYHVIEVASGQDAIMRAQIAGRVDLIVADLELHGKHGQTVVNALRAVHGFVPVVYVSDKREGLVGVADPVLKKPFLCGEWLRTVAAVVGVLPKDRTLAA